MRPQRLETTPFCTTTSPRINILPILLPTRLAQSDFLLYYMYVYAKNNSDKGLKCEKKDSVCGTMLIHVCDGVVGGKESARRCQHDPLSHASTLGLTLDLCAPCPLPAPYACYVDRTRALLNSSWMRQPQLGYSYSNINSTFCSALTMKAPLFPP